MGMEEVARNFAYHAPNNRQAVFYGEIRSKARELAETIERRCPESREKSLAMTKLEESVMWANASIARNGGGL